MSFRIVKYYLLPVILLFLVQSCDKSIVKSSRPMQPYESVEDFSPEIMIYHLSDTRSKLFVKLNSNDLLYIRNSSSESFMALLQINVSMFGLGTDSLVGELEYNISHSQIEQKETLLLKSFEFDLAWQNNYEFDIEVVDLNRNIAVSNSISVNKSDELVRENFLIYSGNSNIPVFSNYVPLNSEVRIESDRLSNSQIQVSMAQEDLALPPPPYSSSKNAKPDISEMSQLQPEMKGDAIIIPKEKVVSDIRLSSDDSSGIMILARDDYFPMITSYETLVLPLRYISAKKEFEKLVNSNNMKLEFEKFWVNCGDNEDRAKVLIDEYYKRVEKSNIHFSSYKSGWRTDRGLIFIVFGTPTEIERSNTSETWIYGDRTNISSIEFKFNQVENSISTNHFVLERDPIYKSEWARRVESWRNGRILN